MIAEDVELKRYAAFVEVLRSAGAGGTVTVFADRVQSEIASVPSLVADTAPIPPEFFARPITFIPGFGLQQHGDLSSGDPAGPVYVSPVVPRDGVLLLADMFDEATHSDEREPLNKLPTRDHSIRVSTKVWYRDEWVGRKEYLKWLQQRGRPSTSTPSSTDDLNAAREKLGQGVSRELIREARREFAPKAWSKAGKR